MSYTDNSIIISNLLSAGAIHVHTRHLFTNEQLKGLKEIAGVTHYNAGQHLNTRVTIGSGFPRSYNNNVSVGRVFTFEELAPQIILVMADAMGVKLEELDVRVERGLTQEQDGTWVVEAARKLRKQPAERNPRFKYAATLDDVVDGVELLTVGTLRNNSAISHFTPNGKIVESEWGGIYAQGESSDRCLHNGGRSLADMGVISYGSAWNEGYITIVNTTDNRRKLVEWLLTFGGGRPLELVNKLLETYPADFTAKVVLRGGKLVAEIV